MTCEGTKHRFNLSRLADGDAPWLCECGAVEWMEENGNLDCVSLDLEKVLRVAQENDMQAIRDACDGPVVRVERRLKELGQEKFQLFPGCKNPHTITFVDANEPVQPDHLIEPPK